VVDYQFISDNWVLYPVFGGLLPELGLLVVSSGGLSVYIRIFGYLVVYSRNLVYGWFPMVDYRFISDNWVFYPVFGGLLPELGLLVVSSG
jgi:hypothetical protein